MKISIITVTKNSEETILETLNSVYNQSYKNIEYIIVDGGSTDKTLQFISNYTKKVKIIHQKKKGIYNAFNLGIKHATGDYIGILNSDDIFDNNKIIENVSKIIKKNKKQIYFGNVCYFHGNKFKKKTRYYTSKNFVINHLKYGFMPPHTSTFVKKEVYEKIKYDENFLIAGDYKFFVETLLNKKMSFSYMNLLVTRMKTGGLSGKNMSSYFQSSKEIISALSKITFFPLVLMVFLRGIVKIKEIIFIKKNVGFFKRTESEFFQKNIVPDFTIIRNGNKLINSSKNFIYSALNLAFLGYLAKKEIQKNKYYYHWPDGNFAKIIDKKLKKIPGRVMLKKIKIKKNIKRIVVLGNLSEKSEDFLRKKFKRKISRISLPYGNIETIVSKIKYKFTKNELIFITLPTPKQEQIAEFIASKYKFFKIICIGASIGMISGDEKPVPNILLNLEFLWRLRFEPRRRVRRLLISFFFFLKGGFNNKRKIIRVKYV